MWHRVAVKQHRLAKCLAGFFDQPAQRIMPGMPEALQSRFRLRAGHFAAIDVPPACDHAGNHPEPRRDARIMCRSLHPFDHRRVQLIRAPVKIDKGARCPGGKQGRTKRGGGAEQLIDERILGRADGMAVQRAALQKIRRIGAPGMRRGKNDRAGLLPGPVQHIRVGGGDSLQNGLGTSRDGLARQKSRLKIRAGFPLPGGILRYNVIILRSETPCGQDMG